MQDCVRHRMWRIGGACGGCKGAMQQLAKMSA